MQHQRDCAFAAMLRAARIGPSNELGVVDGLASVTQSAWGLVSARDVPVLTVTIQ
ncbi:MAG TPA: hypothetical protein VLI21_08140 [Casimicrobiaceae bacterium]|nr:hypothetical protein [Casimicrobiaceae bacterium]